MFGQTYSPTDLGVVALLVLLEGLLSIDNALVLALLARRLPKAMHAKALTYGLGGSFVFRFIAIASAAYLLHWRIVKLIGGAYLLWISGQHFFSKESDKKDPAALLEDDPCGTSEPPAGKPAPGFWHTVGLIEVTDIAFAIDSILAAIALVGPAPPGHTGPHPKLWVVLTGGMLGVILMRVAAAMFIKLLEAFPRFETSAYLLVATIGVKLLVDWSANSAEHPDRADFHNASSPLFWVFWSVMLICVSIGFVPRKKDVEAR